MAVLDTGIDATHPDLAGKVLAERNFTDGFEDDLDNVGHGTHVASTIAGTGAASGGRYRGVAPDATLYDGKVCVVNGCAESWIIAGMEWAAVDLHARVVNISIGGPDREGLDPLEQAVQTLSAQYGTLFVIASGNEFDIVDSPASADAALAVGAVSKTEQLADFSNRGPRVGDAALKPDLTGPGVDITAARSKDSFLGNPGDRYLTLSGTSMATPHVAASAAILAQQHPDWSGPALKAALMAAAKPNPAIGVFGQGAGRVDVGRAIHESVTANPPSVSYGLQSFPHTDDAPIGKPVTYHNYGTTGVTLDLALHTTTENGAATPAGMFTLSATTLAVPAGGDATVTVTVDTRVAGGDGLDGGNLTATAGDLVVQTPIAVVKEVESYDLTLAVTDRGGHPTASYQTIVQRVDVPAVYRPYDPDGTAILRLPKGKYVITTAVVEDGATTQLAQPSLDLTSVRTVNLDARLGRPVSVTVPRPSAVSGLAQQWLIFERPDIVLLVGWSGDSFDGFFSAQVGGDPRKVDGFASWVVSQWGERAPDGTFRDGAFQYNLSWFERGRMLTGLRRRVVDKDLATVRAHLAPAATASTGLTVAFARVPGTNPFVKMGLIFRYTLPAVATEFFNTDDGILWGSQFMETVNVPTDDGPFESFLSNFQGADRTPPARRTTHETWNGAVTGPGFAAVPGFPHSAVHRNGDALVYDTRVYADGMGRPGFMFHDPTGTATLFREGAKIAETDSPGFGTFTLPPAMARYRLELRTDRSGPWEVSPHFDVAWTFRSDHETVDKPLAMSTIRFAPSLDERNTAPGGILLPVPVTVSPQPGSSAGPPRRLTVEVSVDDGVTWRTVALLRGDDGRTVALVPHPDAGGFVSLRAKATDAAGNTVEETIIRGYGVRPRG